MRCVHAVYVSFNFPPTRNGCSLACIAPALPLARKTRVLLHETVPFQLEKYHRPKLSAHRHMVSLTEIWLGDRMACSILCFQLQYLHRLALAVGNCIGRHFFHSIAFHCARCCNMYMFAREVFSYTDPLLARVHRRAEFDTRGEL